MGPIKSNFYHELLVELSCDKSEATKIGLQWCLIPFNTRGWIATAPFWLALAELETLGLQLRQAKQSQHFRVCFYFRSENSAIFENSSTPRTMNWYGLAHFAHSMSKEHRADFLPHTGKQHKEMKWMPPPLYNTQCALKRKLPGFNRASNLDTKPCDGRYGVWEISINMFTNTCSFK